MKQYKCIHDTYDRIKAGTVGTLVWEGGHWFYRFKIDNITSKVVFPTYVEDNPMFFEKVESDAGVQYSDNSQVFNSIT